MSIQRTRWRPDTCSCVLVYAWDDASPEEGRVHTCVQVEPCGEHAAVAAKGDLQATFEAVLAHNRAENERRLAEAGEG